MSFSEVLLIVLSIATPIIAAISVVWGLTREVAVKDADGGKQLTRAGRIAIGLAGVSAIVAVTSIGFRAIIDNNKAQVAQDREAEAKRAKKAELLDQGRWRAFNRRQQEALAKFGISTTRQEGGRVVSNQQLLAAIEEQRDRTIAGNARLFQLAQSQRIVLQGQPLGSLRVRMTFGGFSDAEFERLKQGFAQVADYSETDDTYGRLVDAKRYFDDSNNFRLTFIPMLEMLMGGDDQSNKADSLILALDIDGTGAWVLPIGVTNQKTARGLVFNDSWLYALGDPYGMADDGVTQDRGACTVPRMQLDVRKKEVSLEVNVQGNCLPYAIHRAGNASAIARLSSGPAMVIYTNGTKEFNIEATNVADISDWIGEQCWAGGGIARGTKYIKLTAVPNQRRDLAIARTMRFVGVGDMTYQVINEMRREDTDAGACARFK